MRYPSHPCRAPHWLLTALAVALAIGGGMRRAAAYTSSTPMLAAAPAIEPDFRSLSNTYFIADSVTAFDPATGRGTVKWRRSEYRETMAFNKMSAKYTSTKADEWPTRVYAVDPELPFSLEFVGPRAVRLRMATAATPDAPRDELMLVGEPKAGDSAWSSKRIDGGWEFRSEAGSIVLHEKPWSIEVHDASGRLLTSTVNAADDLPFCFVRRTADFQRRVAPVWSLAPGEKIFGGGESYTPLDKRGQKMVLWSHDVEGAEMPEMYKPVPFFLSSRGYGMFFHTSAPIEADIGATNMGRAAYEVADDAVDLFIFLGEPKDVIGSYTALTGRSPMPPLWSFGLWMSRITYKSEDEVRAVARGLREHEIPADVIHLDTGWFETDWQCDYEFSPSRFRDPGKMIADLRDQGLHISLWQLPYFVPPNKLFPEILSKGLAVHDAFGGLPTEDAILDFSNPATVAWYQDKLAGLLKLGVGAIKVDFGEGAPEDGLYASGRTGLLEHNLYPLRYQKAVADITRSTTGEDIIWARAGWAGSQRYPVHWSGDSAATDSAMAGTLRAGLSLGVCGFTFWSHDIGGFFAKPSEDLYRRWLPFGLLVSHSRCHGQPPREPWEYSPAFLDGFRRADDMRYQLMPYIYAQAKDSSERGLPMVRALFIEFPGDPGSWLVDDQYLFGSSLLVAPLLEGGTDSRDVYLPPGNWIDYQTGRVYAGGWHHIQAGEIPVVLLVRDGSVIPHAALAQSTRDIDWTKLELRTYATAATHTATGLVYLPSGKQAESLSVDVPATAGAAPRLTSDPLAGRVRWTLTRASLATP